MTFKVFYEVFIILLIITYGILLLTPPERNPVLTADHLELFDWMVLVLLAADFAYRLWKADDRGKFLKSSWWELIALIPLDPSFRFVRLLRFLRLVALVRSSPLIWELLTAPALLRVMGFTAVVVLWSSLGIYVMEKGINDSIATFGDAVWWSIVTTTTVGYGDISPSSLGGRIIAVFLMITGIGMIGTFTANLASHWIQYTQRAREGVNAEEDLKSQLAKWVERIEELTDKEYKLMLDTMELLRGQKDGEGPPDNPEFRKLAAGIMEAAEDGERK